MEIGSVKRRGRTKDAVIESKDQRWHCRNRITLVFGSNDVEELDTYVYEKENHSIEFRTVKMHQAKSKAIEEILDNCIDEYYRGHVTEIHTSLSDDNRTVIIEDNGIGFPLGKVVSVYSEFRTGSKFQDDGVDSKGFLNRTLGQNGLGAAATCLTSDLFEVRVRHYNSKKERTFKFLDGALKIKKSKMKSFNGHSGVKVTLTLSEEVYKNNIIDEQLLQKRIIDLAYNNPGLAFYFNKKKYLFKKGLFELAQYISEDSALGFGEYHYVYEKINASDKKVKGKIDLSLSFTLDKNSEERERFISFANSSPTFDGGFHQDRIKRIFVNSVKEKLGRVVKKEKISITDNDVMTGLTFIIGVTMPNPRFESQTKRKLVRDVYLEKAIDQLMSENMSKYLRKNGEFLDLVIERARFRHRFQELKDASKKGRKQKKQRVDKLLDANERRDRSKCTLFIVEGESAIGGLRSSRNKLLQGGISLKGKPMNVIQASIKDILENKEFSDIMASINLIIGKPVEFDNLRYSNVVFLSDSDVDGGHINTLLANFFFSFWPELFEKGIIQIAKAPLFELLTDKGKKFAETPEQLELIKNSGLKIREIQRNKGLGEMSMESWKFVINRSDYTKITVDDMMASKRMLEVCFGKDSAPRKELLLDSDEGVEGQTVEKRVIKKTVVKKKVAKKKIVKKKVVKKKIVKKKKKKK